MIAMVINVTIHFPVTFVTKITNLPMVAFAIIRTNVSNVQWLRWLRDHVRSFFFLLIFSILFLSVFNTTFLYTSFNLLFIFIAQLQLCYRVPLPHK
jgi:hypothetical protein